MSNYDEPQSLGEGDTPISDALSEVGWSLMARECGISRATLYETMRPRRVDESRISGHRGHATNPSRTLYALWLTFQGMGHALGRLSFIDFVRLWRAEMRPDEEWVDG